MAEPENLRVLDATEGIAGAYAALLLHQAGAQVVYSLRPEDDPELPTGSPLWGYLRQGQALVAWDQGLVAGSGADVVLATPASRDREAVYSLKRAARGLIVVAFTPYGLEGPYRDRPASDLTEQADSGALAIRGNPGEEPIQMGGRTVQWLGGAYGAATALALWRARRHGGSGGLVDVSLAEVANTGAANLFDVFHAVGLGPDAEPTTAPRGFETPSIERTADGWVGFNTNGPHQIVAFLEMMGRKDLVESGEWTMASARHARIEEWQALVTAWTSVRSTEEVLAQAVAHHVPVAPVTNGRTVAQLDQVIARQSLIAQPGGTALVPRRPWRLGGQLPPEPDPAPDPASARPGPVHWRPRAADLVPPAPSGSADLPLAGLRVLDLTTWWAGPAATGFLASLGADVIHVEGPDHMDGVRLVGLTFAERSTWWELSPFFLAVNVNKRGIALHLGSGRGRELALALMGAVDVVVENFTPRVLDRFDLGWEVLHAAHPRTTLVRMPAFGLDGPWRDRPGFAQNIEQATGLAWLTGQADDQPRIQRGPCDPNGGVHAAIALMAALEQRERTGEGSLVEVALFDAALALAAEPIIEWSAHGVLLERDGNRSQQAAPQGVYRCAGDDRWLALSVTDDAQFQALAATIGRDELAADPTLESLSGRQGNHARLDEILAAWAAGQDLDGAVERLVAAGVPAAPAWDPRLVGRHPQFQARGYHQMVDHPVAGRLPIPTLPLRIEGVEHWVRRPAPCFGEHTDEVLTELLELSPGELKALRDEGIVADRPNGV